MRKIFEKLKADAEAERRKNKSIWRTLTEVSLLLFGSAVMLWLAIASSQP